MSNSNETENNLAGEGANTNDTKTEANPTETGNDNSTTMGATVASNGHTDETKEGGDDGSTQGPANSAPTMNGHNGDENENKIESTDQGTPATTTTVAPEPVAPIGAEAEDSTAGKMPAVMYNVTSPELSSKASIRRITWKYLDSSGLVLFPRPCLYRIPRFKGENEAVEKLASLDIFKNAKIIKTNLDKSHERLRFEVINTGKELVVGAPGLREAVFYHMRPPMGTDEWRNHVAASRLGITSLASALIFNSETKADLIILGSVAVDKKGRRVGKGDGFSDLEFALLSTLGGISSDATVVTVVHDSQVFDEFPDTIFKNYDVPVDVIVTPTQVINVESRLPRPTLHWDLLSLNRVNEIPILKLLMDLEKTKGVSIVLKPNDPPAPIPSLMPRRKFFRNTRRQPNYYPNQRTPFMRPNAFINRSWSRGNATMFNPRNIRRPQLMDGTRHHQQQQQQFQRFTRQRENSGSMKRPQGGHNDVIRVKGLNASVRIRDLKTALYTRGVRPSGISWRPKSGLAILYFNTEPTPMPSKMNGHSHASADELVTMLKGLSVNADDGSVMRLNFEVTNTSQN